MRAETVADEKQGFSKAQPISRWKVIEGLDFWSFSAYY
jgi:hypothetical protein